MNALAQNVTKLSKDYEALKKKCRQLQAEIEVLKEMLACEGVEASREFLDYQIKAILRKAQEK